MAVNKEPYPASLEVDYPQKLDRLTTFFRILLSIPIVILFSVLVGSGGESYTNQAGEDMTATGLGITGGLFVATVLMIVFRQRYPRWWFNFALELNRFTARISAYLLLLTDRYPSTVDKQTVHLEVAYPNAKTGLNRWLPLVKWLLAVPHYVILLFLSISVIFATIIAWFAILFTGQYPKSIFEFVVGVSRWSLRVEAYAFLLTTDVYPPFSLK